MILLVSFTIGQPQKLYSVKKLTESCKSIKEQKTRIALEIIKAYNKIAGYQIEYKLNKQLYDDFILTHKEPEEESNKKAYREDQMDYKRAYIKPQIKAKRLQWIIKTLEDKSSNYHDMIRREEYGLHRKLVMALSAFIFAILGAPLGIYSKRAGKSLGLGVSVLIIVSFILLLLLGNLLMKKQILSPVLSNWYVLSIFFILGIHLLYKRLKGA